MANEHYVHFLHASNAKQNLKPVEKKKKKQKKPLAIKIQHSFQIGGEISNLYQISQWSSVVLRDLRVNFSATRSGQWYTEYTENDCFILTSEFTIHHSSAVRRKHSIFIKGKLDQKQLLLPIPWNQYFIFRNLFSRAG